MRHTEHARDLLSVQEYGDHGIAMDCFDFKHGRKPIGTSNASSHGWLSYASRGPEGPTTLTNVAVSVD